MVIIALVGIAGAAIDVAVGRISPDVAIGNLLPEGAQPVETLVARIAADDRGIDRADRDAGHPIGLDIGLVQRLDRRRLDKRRARRRLGKSVRSGRSAPAATPAFRAVSQPVGEDRQD